MWQHDVLAAVLVSTWSRTCLNLSIHLKGANKMLNDCSGSSSHLAGTIPCLTLLQLAINTRICGASVPLRPQMKMRFVSFRYIDTLYTCMHVCEPVCGTLHRAVLVKSLPLSVSDPRWVMIWSPPRASSFPCSFPCKINELTHTHTYTYNA